ncbi:thioredoxin [bacterium]|jgi:thioredoxin 1|nr:thioredoxin [bacterium]
MGKYIELTNENFESTTNEGISLVDFWAPWCGPCKMLTPIIEELAEDFEGKANICKVNTDNQQELAVKFGIKSIPSIFLIKNGEVVSSFNGVKSKQVLAASLDELLK